MTLPRKPDATDDASIEAHVVTCLASFKLLANAFEASEDQHQVALLKAALADCNGRFRVWCGNVGAHRTGKASLDYRLRNSSTIKTGVIRLLRDLNGLLSDGKCCLNFIYVHDLGNPII